MDVRVGLWRKLRAEELMLLKWVLEKTLESPLDCKEIQPVHSEEDQPWDFFGRHDAKAETPVLWPPDGKSWLIGKDSDAVRNWGQEEKGMTEDEMAGWHHRLNGNEFEWTLGVGDGQGGLACCDSWGCKESDTTERLNWTEHVMMLQTFELAYFLFVYLSFWKIHLVFEKKKKNVLLNQTWIGGLLIDNTWCLQEYLEFLNNLHVTYYTSIHFLTSLFPFNSWRFSIFIELGMYIMNLFHLHWAWSCNFVSFNYAV